MAKVKLLLPLEPPSALFRVATWATGFQLMKRRVSQLTGALAEGWACVWPGIWLGNAGDHQMQLKLLKLEADHALDKRGP